MTNSTGTVNVLVYFTPAGATASSVVAVLPVTVRPARAITSMVLDKSSDVISTESANQFNETTFKVTLKDQLGDPIEGEIEIVSNVKNLPNGATAVPVVGAVEGADGEYTFTVTGSAPERYSPSGRPAVTIESVINTILSFPLHLSAILTASGATWRKSQIISP